MRIFDSPRDRAQLLVVGLGAAVAVALFPFVPGLLGAAILFVVFAPVHRRLKRRIAPRLSAAGVVLAAAALVLVPGALLAALVIDRVPGLLHDLQQSELLARLAGLRIGEIEVGEQVAAASGALLSWISHQGLTAVTGLAQATINLTLALFGLYYLLLATPATWNRVAAYLPFSPSMTQRLASRFCSVTEAMLLGVALTAALQGSVVGLAFWLVGLPEAPFWGVVTAFVSMLPLFGSALVWLPGVAVLVGTGRVGEAIALTALGAGVASNIDNLTRPMVYRRVSHIHPMTTLVGAFAGVAVFGLVGVLLGPLAISYFFELLRMYREEYGAPAPGASAAVSAREETPLPTRVIPGRVTATPTGSPGAR